VLASLLTGCFDSNETAEFSGHYVNQNNADKLVFNNKQIEIQSNGQVVVAPFTIDDDMVIIEVKRSSQEKRPDIVMRIHGDGELLTCSACAIYNLSNIWTREK
jgi:hypothetical protein